MQLVVDKVGVGLEQLGLGFILRFWSRSCDC